MLRIASWNVNSINARLQNVLDWLQAAEPDVVLLQEIKCPDDGFPLLAARALGYHGVVHGQKSYNGVAILAKEEPEAVVRGLSGETGDAQARYLEATVRGVRVASIYLPNGNPVGGEKFAYKLAWMARLRAHAAELSEHDVPAVLGGDYNVIPEPIDCYDPAAWVDDALFRPETRRAFRSILYLGWYDAYRALHPTRPHAYTYWDYQAGAFQTDRGIRIDHHLLSPRAVDRLVGCTIDKVPRGRAKSSDHTPIVVELDV